MKDYRKTAIQNYVTSYNNFDIPGMLVDLADNIVFENISNGQVDLRTEGIEAFQHQAEKGKDLFRDRQQTITSWSFHPQKVIIDIDYRATLAVDLPNGLKKGDKIEMTGKSEFEFEKEKIIFIRDIS